MEFLPNFTVTRLGLVPAGKGCLADNGVDVPNDVINDDSGVGWLVLLNDLSQSTNVRVKQRRDLVEVAFGLESLGAYGCAGDLEGLL